MNYLKRELFFNNFLSECFKTSWCQRNSTRISSHSDSSYITLKLLHKADWHTTNCHMLQICIKKPVGNSTFCITESHSVSLILMKTPHQADGHTTWVIQAFSQRNSYIYQVIFWILCTVKITQWLNISWVLKNNIQQR